MGTAESRPASRLFFLLFSALLLFQAVFNFLLILHTHPRYIMMPHFLLTLVYQKVAGIDASFSGLHILPHTGLLEFARCCFFLSGGKFVAAPLVFSLYWLALLIVIFLLGCELADDRAGFFASLTMTLIPFAAGMSRNFDVHVPRMLFIALFWLLLIKAEKMKTLPFVAWCVFALGGGLYHSMIPTDFLLFLLGVSGVLAFHFLTRRGIKVRIAGVVFLISTVVAVLISFRDSMGLRWIFSELVSGDYHSVSPLAWLKSALFYPSVLLLEILGVVAAPLFIFGILRLWRNKESASNHLRKMSLFGFLVPFIILILVPKKNLYYIGIVLPFLSVAAGAGLALTVQKRAWLSWVTAGLLLGSHVAYVAAMPPLIPFNNFFADVSVTNNIIYEADSGITQEIMDNSAEIEAYIRSIAPDGKPVSIVLLSPCLDEQLVIFDVLQKHPNVRFVNMTEFLRRDVPLDLERFDGIVFLCLNHNREIRLPDEPADSQALINTAEQWYRKLTPKIVLNDNDREKINRFFQQFKLQKTRNGLVILSPA